MKNRIIILLLFIPIALHAQKISPEAIRYDFEIFRQALQETHPGMYRFTGKQSFDTAFDNTAKNITDSLTSEEFFKMLAPLVARVKCGHVKFFPSQGNADVHQFHYFFDTTRLFPYELFFSEGRVLLKGSYSVNFNNEHFGARLLTINGMSINKITEKLLDVIPADGNVVSSKYLELNNYFPAWYANFFQQTDLFTIEIEKTNGFRETLQLQPVSLSAIRVGKKQEQRQEPNFSLTFPEKEVAVMKIHAFYPLSENDDFKEFLKESFRQIHANNTEHLILDLRNNEGGNDRWGALLYSYFTDKKFRYYKELRLSGIKYTTEPYLQKPKFFGLLKLLVRKKDGKYYWTKHKNLKVQKPQKDVYKGAVYVLLNGNSFSVTSEFAAIAKSNRRAIFFGQESGGTYEGNNSGTFAFVNLPHSKLTLAIPLLAYYLDVKAENPMDRGILPDYPIEPVLSHSDNELEYVMEFIRKTESGKTAGGHDK